MKKIAVLAIVILVFVSSAANGYSGYYTPLRYRLRWNPYAGGLVPGYLGYSPYAFSYNYPSGLVPDWVRYCPYAFSYSYPSGLVDDYGGYSLPPLIVQAPKTPDCPQVEKSREPVKPRENGKWIVYNELKTKGLDPEMVDGFSFRNETVSAVFEVKSHNLLICCRNPEMEKILEGNTLWQGYKKRWEEKEKEYRTKGWEIGNINIALNK